LGSKEVRVRFSQPLDDLLVGKSHIKVLRALAGIPAGIDLSIREVARRAGVTHPTASTVLEGLRKQGVVRVRRTLWADEFQVNPEHVLWQRVGALLRWERKTRAELLSFLSKEIRSQAPWVTSAYLFGSASRDDMKPDSDLDVAVICPRAKAKEAKRMLEELGELTIERYGNRVSGIVGTRSIVDLAKPGQPGYRLWKTIAKQGISLLSAGSE
jgi:predicted nucleotidyltransferase